MNLRYPSITTINMQERGDQCCICGEFDLPQWGVPVSASTGRIVSNEFQGEWGGKPACRQCHAKHEAGEFVGTYPRF